MPRTHKTVKDKLDEALGVANEELGKNDLPKVEILPPVPPGSIQKFSRPEEFDPQCEADLQFAHTTYTTLIEKGMEALEGILQLAQDSEHPRPYEVAGLVLKAVSDINTAFVSLREKMRSIRGEFETAEQITKTQGDTTNFVFATSLDVLEMVEKAREAKKVLNR